MDPSTGGNMNAYYSRQYSADDLQRLAQVENEQAMMGMMGNGLDSHAMLSGQSLDELINQNNKELQRRRSYHYQYPGPRAIQDGDLRRSTLMEFGLGPGSGSDMDGFQFDPGPIAANMPTALSNGGGIAQRRMESRQGSIQQHDTAASNGLNTQMQDVNGGYDTLTQSPQYQRALDTNGALSLDVSGDFMSSEMAMGMDYVSGLDPNMSGDVTPVNMFSGNGYEATLTASPIQQTLSASLQGQTLKTGGGRLSNGAEQAMMEKLPAMNMSDALTNISPGISMPPGMQGMDGPGSAMHEMTNFNQVTSPVQSSNLKMDSTAVNSFSTGVSPNNTLAQRNIPQYLNAYSSSGFDMLGVLMRVAARPKPQINIGAVDMSCAFVVCDVTQHDLPIVYCSDIFERLTGYSKHEILGRNCRFLQAPDGKVKSGVKRKYVDDEAVLHLKNMINQRQEAQISLINYRKGGQPFMNLLTMIPITYDSDEIKYYVGFQVDLVETPTSITNKNPDGTYAINYQRGMLPRYVFNTPEMNNHRDMELGQTIGRDEVSTVLSTIGTGESELSKRIWDKVLLENTDDVVHVLSLKGLFLYLSPSSRKILEYEPHELVGTALSSVCHPSDIVPVTRELKDTSTGTAVNVVFRIRRKHSGYTWFESHGSLHTEQGKGKKCIILVGRERPVYALARKDILDAGGIGENELWAKMSTSGMFLYVSSNSHGLLERSPEELIGTSAQALMRAESKAEFGRMLEIARTGIRATFKHDVQNRRGQTLHAQTTIYPGDAGRGEKPTFLVAQTRLLKMVRGSSTAPRQSSGASAAAETKTSVGSASPATNVSGGTQGTKQNSTPLSSGSNAYGDGVVTQAGGNGLAIGTQHEALASDDNVFDELKTTRSTSWQFELRQMEKRNRLLTEELLTLQSNKKKRKRRKGLGQLQKDCANCHTRSTPEWRRGPSGNRDLCNSCGLRWAKQNGRVSPRASSQQSDRQSLSPTHSSPILTSVGKKDGGGVPEPGLKQGEKVKKTAKDLNINFHNAKTARMEAASSAGFGGGIPAKIEEGEEP